ncbi:putative C-5 sterol desaturase [Cardiosporidium cionae]|uniref:C-5 sterol desaturase n=1 Tax=Cardiosporidium cionae TaxID=476202 RepID=A0ABQ7J863_9APIC|nr:putative C-5 sterol desaturase [Cardiosporidium cionae]|eukprot:KAF8820124.1 putative C-5 sterol desaturase [Cardiosporidium cionae]
MVLCEIFAGRSLPEIWFGLYAMAFFFVNGLSTVYFYFLYWNPTYKTWVKKSNPAYPKAAKIREEIFQMNKGLVMAALPPALSLWLSHTHFSYGYCGFSATSFKEELIHQLWYLIFLDFIEFFYHYGTHVNHWLWKLHKYHHTFYNPTPFAVIADEVIDQLVRALPMAIFPLFVPLNLDIMFFQMALVIYGYGTYLHCGHEMNFPDAHNSMYVLNTSYQHFCHHSISVYRKPFHCGFVLNIFDKLFGSVYKGECFCCKCCEMKGERSIEKWKALKKPNYKKMLSWPFWQKGLAIEWNSFLTGNFFHIF